jgi:hypothetical protein
MRIFNCTNIAVLGAAFFLQMGCATDVADGSDPDDVVIETVERAARPSFLNSCQNGVYFLSDNNAAFTGAFADKCRKNDGSSVSFPPPHWGDGNNQDGPFCFTDIANCNGRLICGGC